MKKYLIAVVIGAMAAGAFAGTGVDTTGAPPFMLKWGMTPSEAKAVLGGLDKCKTSYHLEDINGEPGEFCYLDLNKGRRDTKATGIIKSNISLRFLKACGLYRVIYTEWFDPEKFMSNLDTVFNELASEHNITENDREFITFGGGHASSYFITARERGFSAYSHESKHRNEKTVVMLHRSNCTEIEV